jgi:hypothetical protein
MNPKVTVGVEHHVPVSMYPAEKGWRVVYIDPQSDTPIILPVLAFILMHDWEELPGDPMHDHRYDGWTLRAVAQFAQGETMTGDWQESQSDDEWVFGLLMPGEKDDTAEFLARVAKQRQVALKMNKGKK